MIQTKTRSLLDRMLDPLSRCFDAESARRVIELRIDPSVQDRVSYLAEQANEGLITPEERSEYEVYINAADFIAVVQLKAENYLAGNGTA